MAQRIERAVVLAAGRGERMWPFAEVRNKCAVSVGGRPGVRRLAAALAEAGLRGAAVVVGAMPGSVRAALLGGPLPAAFAEQPRPTGTADAALLGLAAAGGGPALIAFGDIATDAATVRRVLDAWDSGEAEAVALVQRVQPPAQPGDWIGAHVEGGLLREVEGHSRGAPYRLCGLVAMDERLAAYLAAAPDVFESVPVGGMPPAERDLFQALGRFAADGHRVAAVEPAGFFVDLDKPWHILEANLRALEADTASLTEHRIHPTARVHDGADVRGFLSLGPGSVVGDRVVIAGSAIVGARTQVINGAIVNGPAQIGDDCRVSDYCLVDGGTTVGDRCVVGHGAEMSGVQLDGSYLWHYCEIYGVVGQSVDIGAATVCGTLRFDDGRAEHRVRGRRELPEQGANATYFGDFSRTGVNVITQPGVKIGAYSCVGAGVVLYDDVPSRTLRLLRQETVDRPWGPERYGW